MRDLLKGWDPKLQTLLELVDQTQKWRLLTSSEMEDWGHQAGKFTLLGDACHAMPPYLCVIPTNPTNQTLGCQTC